MKAKCINGRYDENNSRGNNGLYNFVYSNEIEITGENPCNDPNKSGVKLSLTIQDMVVPIGETRLAATHLGPLDEISATFGTGNDRCGEMFFRMTDDQKIPLNLDNFSFNFISNFEARDNLEMVLLSEAYGTWIEANVLLHAYLVDQPKAVDRYFPFKLKWRECLPLDFREPKIGNLRVKIGEDAYPVNYRGFDQSPCDFPQIYEAFLVLQSGQVVELPEWIRQSDKTKDFVVYPKESGIVEGDYTILLRSTIFNDA